MVRWLKTNKLSPLKQALSIFKELFVSIQQGFNKRQWSLSFKWVSHEDPKELENVQNVSEQHCAYLGVCVYLQLEHWLQIRLFNL